MEQKFYKKFGKAIEEECLNLEATTWDGQSPVLILFPKKITKKIKEEVKDFLLGELDDHDVLDKFLFLCDLIETAKRRKVNLKKTKDL